MGRTRGSGGGSGGSRKRPCVSAVPRQKLLGMIETAQSRAQAGRVAQWLVEKGHPDDAVVLLAAWAATGPNDSEGQQLLAQALRIDPSAPVAQMAFERMEGVPGTHQALDAAIARFDAAELARLDAEMRRPTFRRAQMGFNNNIKYREQVFHVQTEDSGLDAPHIITHLFADGGRVIKSHKRKYDDQVARADVAEFVRGLMKAQHLEMCLWLREGRFDAIIAGQEIGGVALLEAPPNVDLKRLATKREPAEAAPRAPAAAGDAPRSPAEPVRFRLLVSRSLSGGPERYEPAGDQVIIGNSGAVALAGERFCHPAEARVRWHGGRLTLEDLEGGNGVFLRLRTPVELEVGDQFVIGDQLLVVERNPDADDGPDPAPTYFYSSPKWPSSFRIVQLFEGGAPGACVVARGSTLQIGSAVGDLVFPDDPLVSAQHCVVEEQAGSVVLTDLSSRTGVFVRLRGLHDLVAGDELLIGRTRLVVELPQE